MHLLLNYNLILRVPVTETATSIHMRIGIYQKPVNAVIQVMHPDMFLYRNSLMEVV